ncbi:MAG: pantoate--beta-alanine ligase [Sneathiellales bacterium]|nr:pantoate--beta-alanine ligase [Sneathiellales bacterium]
MTLEIARTINQIREKVALKRNEGKTVALVPTMGSLHEGHLSLVRQAAEQADIVCVSLFVNPRQFGPDEDFDTYPREEEKDIAKLEKVGAHLLFAPTPEEIYPQGHSTSVDIGALGTILEGEHRPGFFTGVATVVTKLLLQVMPDKAIFGEKDYQQLMVIRKFVRDLNIPVEILSGETVREADGLALSSRNAYLSAEERKVAPFLHHFMQDIAKACSSGETQQARELLNKAPDLLKEAGFDKLDYLELRSSETLSQDHDNEENRRLLAAVWLGKTRLIDNIAIL